MERITYKYSLGTIIFDVCFWLFFGAFPLSVAFDSYRNENYFGLIIISSLSLVAIVGLIYTVINGIIPFIKEEIALVISDEEIFDCSKNIRVKWQNVVSLKFTRAKNRRVLELNLKNPVSHSKEVYINLSYVEGDNKDIYTTALTYFNNSGTPADLDI